jgi:hypothetical protein
MVSEKRCTVCGAIKPLDDFYKAAGMRDGRRNDCKQCNLSAKHNRYLANPEAEKARVLAWQRANRERYRESQRRMRQSPEGRRREREGHLRRTHGLTLDEYDAMVVGQGGRCRVCGRCPEKNFHIDHDHVTGRIRGLLCSSCNHAIGLMGESPQRLRRAADYVTRPKRRPPVLDRRLAELKALRLQGELVG